MAEINGQEAVPVVFEYSANVFCKYCHTWGTVDDPWTSNCGNCGLNGYLMLNPFPDNKIPYVILPPTPPPLSKEG